MTKLLLPLYFTVPLLIYFVIILAIAIASIIKVVKFWKLKKIKNNDLIIGFIISLFLFGILYFIYEGEKEKLSLILFGPLLLFFLPYCIHIAAHREKKENYTYKLSAIVIVSSMLLVFLRAVISSFL
jgi:peptidoglycan/LPS O-acetylase OafA/YrhL